MINIPTFAAWMEDNRAQSFPNQATAWAVYNERVYRDMRFLYAHPEVAGNRQEAVVAEIAATAFVVSVFGSGWVKKKFPIADQREELGLWVRQARQRQELARRIFEFQNEPWFADFLSYTKANDIASAIFEADILQTLMRTGLPAAAQPLRPGAVLERDDQPLPPGRLGPARRRRTALGAASAAALGPR